MGAKKKTGKGKKRILSIKKKKGVGENPVKRDGKTEKPPSTPTKDQEKRGGERKRQKNDDGERDFQAEFCGASRKK